MKSRHIRVLVALATLMTFVAAGSAAATPSNDVRSEHQRIVDFWTHERVAKAIPRDFVFERGPGLIPAARPPGAGKPGGGGGGGGGEDSTVVTGASWNGGGLVLESTGKVLFQMGTSYYVCSAAVVADPGGTGDADSLILTAAHCAYDESGNAFATNWLFIPAYDKAPAPLNTSGSFCADTAYGCWSAAALTVHTGYASAGGFNTQAVTHDYAVATVYGGGKSGTAKLDATVGAQAIAFSHLANAAQVYAFGYPAAQKYKGNDLVYCGGPVSTDPNTSNATYRLGCDMTGGSSGGPWLASFVTGAGTLSSVNSYGYRGDSHMYGPKFDSKTQAVYSAADNRTGGNQIVP